MKPLTLQTYSPYGFQEAGTRRASAVNFNGERLDRCTGVYLLGNGYRGFSPALMRFVAPDSWSPFGAGGLNAYAYCAGDPLTRSDPSGHRPFSRFRETTNATRLLPGRALLPNPPQAATPPLAIVQTREQALLREQAEVTGQPATIDRSQNWARAVNDSRALNLTTGRTYAEREVLPQRNTSQPSRGQLVMESVNGQYYQLTLGNNAIIGALEDGVTVGVLPFLTGAQKEKLIQEINVMNDYLKAYPQSASYIRLGTRF